MDLTWRACYRDGQHFDEVDLSGTEHGWREVDHGSVARLCWMHGEMEAVTVDIPTGATPFLFRRKTNTLKMATGEQTNEVKFLALGYERDGERTMLRIHADGTLVLTTRDD